MKKILPLLVGLFCTSIAFSQIVITEIMYNPPESGLDTLEYVEIYNNSTSDIDLTGYSFTQGIEEIPDLGVLPAESYLVICEDSIRFVEAFGNLPYLYEWDSGALSNGGEDIAISDANGITVDSVDYDSGGDWPGMAAGGGSSLERCELTTGSNNAGNWKASNTGTGFFRGTQEVFATPGAAPADDLCENVVTPDDVSLLITEVMYNDPGSTDSLEFIEIYNDGDVEVDLTNYRLTVGSIIDYTFGSMMLRTEQTVLVSKFPDKIQEVFGVNSQSWGSGGISDSGDMISILAANGDVLDSYTIDDATSAADGTGLSWCNCDMVTDAMIDTWDAAAGLMAADRFSYQGTIIVASPMSSSVCNRSTASIATLDTNGVSLLDGSEVVLSGTITSNNIFGNGLQFSLESDSEGIFIFSSVDFGEEIIFEDDVSVQGEVVNFRGIAQIALDTLIRLTNPGAYDAPVTVTTLDESTEAEIVTLVDVTLVDPTEWETDGGSFNMLVTDGTNQYDIRFDDDTDIIGMNYPTGTFSITGVGSQFDQNAPFDSGYQLLPRAITDIDPFNPFVNVYPAISIADVKVNDADGQSSLDGQTYTVSGVVHGIEFNTGGTEFYIIDGNGDGLRIGSGSSTGYTVVEGDEISVEGAVNFFRGVTEFNPDNISIISSGNTLTDPVAVSVLSEDTESDLVVLSGLSYVDASQWNGDGSSFNVIFTDGTNEHEVRIDNDTELSNMTAPFPSSNNISIIGFGSQFDNAAPYDEGYQLFPRFLADFSETTSTKDLLDQTKVDVYPNPVSEVINVSSDILFDRYSILDYTGKIIATGMLTGQIDTKAISTGSYILKLENESQQAFKKIVKQ